MNALEARAIPYQGQFLAQFRRVHKARYETVMADGENLLFPSASEAECAAWRALVASGHLTNLMRRDGCTLSDHARASAERDRVFGKPSRQIVRNCSGAEVIVVQRKRMVRA